MLKSPPPEPPPHYAVKASQRGTWERFCSFWELYPWKVGKLEAWRKYAKLSPGVELHEQILAALRARIERRPKRWPHGRTYLHQAWWEDDLPPAVSLVGYDDNDSAPLTDTERETVLHALKVRGYGPPKWATAEERARHGW